MAYTIYGGYLKPGHCEVHPDITEEYPCRRCQEEEYQHQQEEEYYQQQEQEDQNWEEVK